MGRPSLMTTEGMRMLPDLHGVTYGSMRRICDQLGVTVSSAILPHGLNGLYREADQRILIDRTMTYRQKRCTLAHELMHWKYGDQSCGIPYEERRARKNTALALIDSAEYANAEAIYEGNTALIMDALEVTR